MSVAASSDSRPQSPINSHSTAAGAMLADQVAQNGTEIAKSSASSEADIGVSAHATTSRVTLEEFKKQKHRRLLARKEQLLKTHEQDIRMLCYMLMRNEQLEMEGSPSMPPADEQFQLNDEENRRFQTMLSRYALTGGRGESVDELGIPTLDEARETILRNIAATRKLVLPQRPRPDLSTMGGATAPLTNRSFSQSMLPPTTTAMRGDGVVDRPRKTSAGSASKAAAAAMMPRLPLADVPLMPTAAQVLQIAPQTTLPLPPPPAISILADQPPAQALQLQAQTQALKEASQGSASALTDASSVRLESQGPDSQSTALTVPIASQTSLAGAKLLGSAGSTAVSSESPLHPTLQVLAPNPLSVTYASSLRPLPHDPFRRHTGIGIGGGAIHHRGHRKAPQLPPKNGVPPPAGPAGAGGVDLFQWAVRARASPGAGLVGKADKCLLTTDWKVAFTEQRFIRTMNRIEKLKSEGKWSFRQPKKQKGPAIRKAHWDHLLEEMRWLQTDFKQERRWKIAVAYQLALSAREFVRAKSPEARARLTVRSRPIRHLEDKAMEVEAKTEEVSAPLLQSGDEQGVDVDVDMAADVDEADGDEDIGAEELEDADADGEEDAPGEDDDVDAEGEDDDGEVEAATGLHVDRKEEKLDAVIGQANEVDGEASVSTLVNASTVEVGWTAGAGKEDGVIAKDVNLAEQWPMNVISSVRAPIFAMDVLATTISPIALLEQVDNNTLAEMLGISSSELRDKFSLDQISMSMLFPELPLFDAPSAPTDGKSDRRWDDGSLNQPPRLTHVSRLMDSKPLLVSTLQPSKNRVQSQWRADGEWNVAAELADPTKGVPPELLHASATPGSVLFTRKSSKPSRDINHTSSNAPLPQAPSNAAARSSQFIWTTEDDNFLLSLIRQYGQHWQLISNLFNAARLSVPTDVREAWDCYDRYQKIQQAAAEGKPPPAPVFSSLEPESGGGKSSTGTTTPQQQQQGNSLHLKQEKLTKKLGMKYDGSRKKLRRYNITEVMKKCAKRRAEILQRNVSHSKQVNLQSHETHNQIKLGVTPTPQQLSMLKAERDEAHARQFALMQQQHRQAQAQAQAQAAAAAAAQQQQGQQGAGQQTGASGAVQSATPKPQPAQAQPAASTAPNAQQALQTQQQQHQQQLQAQQQRLLQQLAAQQQQQGGNGQQLTQQQQQQQQQQRFAAAAAAAQQASATAAQQQNGSQQFARPTNTAGSAAPSTASAAAPTAARAAAPSQGRPAQGSAPASTAGAQGIPPQLAALQATLTQSLANNPSFSPEQINTIALQLYRQAQQQGGLGNINLGGQNRQPGASAARPANAGGAQQQGAGQARPPSQGQTPRPPAGSAATSNAAAQPGKVATGVRPPSGSPQKQTASGEAGKSASAAAPKGKKGGA